VRAAFFLGDCAVFFETLGRAFLLLTFLVEALFFFFVLVADRFLGDFFFTVRLPAAFFLLLPKTASQFSENFWLEPTRRTVIVSLTRLKTKNTQPARLGRLINAKDNTRESIIQLPSQAPLIRDSTFPG